MQRNGFNHWGRDFKETKIFKMFTTPDAGLRKEGSCGSRWVYRKFGGVLLLATSPSNVRPAWERQVEGDI
jgi:hypothetical protein